MPTLKALFSRSGILGISGMLVAAGSSGFACDRSGMFLALGRSGRSFVSLGFLTPVDLIDGCLARPCFSSPAHMPAL